MIRNVDVSSICNERVKMVERKKELFQRWLNCLLFSHKIDIEPSPSKPYKSDIFRPREYFFRIRKGRFSGNIAIRKFFEKVETYSIFD